MTQSRLSRKGAGLGRPGGKERSLTLTEGGRDTIFKILLQPATFVDALLAHPGLKKVSQDSEGAGGGTL